MEEPETPKVVEPKQEEQEDVAALKQQLADLRGAQEISNARTAEAERRAQQAAQEVDQARRGAEQSQYDSIVTAMGAAQMEVDSAKRDIVMAGQSQDYVSLADAQERLSAAKSRMVSLEVGKETYESRKVQSQDPIIAGIDNNPNLSHDEKNWPKSHPDSMRDPRMNAKLNAAYYDAIDKGLQRGSREYFDFVETEMGYKARPEPKVEEVKPSEREEEPVIVAAPPSKNVPGNSSGSKTTYTLTKEEAEIARLSGITPAEYVKEKLKLQELKKQGHYISQG
jgi:hypothetical protein